jgi:hypothetical protein
MRYLSIFLFPLVLFAQSHLVSPIPLPRTYVQNLDIYDCDERCLADFVENGYIFSFLAHAPEQIDDSELDEVRLTHVSLFNLGSYRQEQLRIALLLPHSVIGRYANSTTNAVFAYMLTKSTDYEIRTYQIEDESSGTLRRALRQIEEDGFYYVIAPLTKSGAETVASSDPDLTIYFPTINRHDIVSDEAGTGSFFGSFGMGRSKASKRLYFGGIDYQAQLDTLLDEAVSPLVIFYDTSRLGKELHDYAKERFLAPPEDEMEAEEGTAAEEPSMFLTPPPEPETEEEEIPKVTYSYAIAKQTTNLEHQLKENEKIINGSFLLNTPIIKSGMIMSQITLYEANATNILSTQINYDPLLFSMTQFNDRKSMVIANSIGESNKLLVEANRLLNNDIVYDWINYTTSVGIDLFFHMITNEEREYDLPVVENQLQYPIRLVTPSYYRFVKYTPPPEPEPMATDIVEIP